ncbi:MAG TPA: hypothetical protein VJP40_06685 [bacterium]|nr:hypothetical protein [bacterium]
MRWIPTLSFILLAFLSSGNSKAGEGPDPILKKICQSTCTGRMASVQSWNDDAGKAQVYQYQGDLTACSHPPQIFYDASGKELGAIAEFPINPQDPASAAKLKEIQTKRAEWLKGLSPAKKLWCDRL